MKLLDKLKTRKELSEEKTNSYTQLVLLMQEEKYNEALVLHEKFFDKKSEADWYSRGNLLNNLKRQNEAIGCYIKAIELNDTYIKAWFRLGQKYFENSNFREAQKAFVQTSMLEGKIGENEWNTVATFYFMMSLFLEYLSTKDETIGEKIPNQIRKLRQVIDMDENTSDEDFLAYCNENFQNIVNELEPKIVAEFRHPDSIN